MKLVHPDLCWTESGQPYSRHFDDIYFSKTNPVAESQHVFIDGNNLDAKFKATKNNQITIGEIGFGSGLNFLLSWQLWKKINPTEGKLHYIAFEQYPLDTYSHRRIIKLWPKLKSLSDQLLQLMPVASCGIHRVLLQKSVILDLHYGNALERIHTLAKRNGVDAWILDGFKPKSNRDLWQQDLLNELARLSRNDTTLASYSVAGNLRRGLEQAGFATERRPGFGKKRHMLSAAFKKTDTAKREVLSQPWNSIPLSNTRSDKCETAIIGAGLAGSSLAYSLAYRNINATVFESGNTIAAGVASIPQFALRPRLFQTHTPQAEFFLQSYLFAIRQVEQLCKVSDLRWQQSGLIQLQNALNKQFSLDIDQVKKLYPDSVVQSLVNADDYELTGLLENEGLFFPKSGWLCPADLCRTLLEISQCDLKLNTKIVKINRPHNKWLLEDSNGRVYSFQRVLLANSYCVSRFALCNELPIEAITGQTSIVTASPSSSKQNNVICGMRTIFPPLNKDPIGHLIAANYQNSSNRLTSEEDDQKNLELARRSFKQKSYLSNEITESHIAVRSNTPDRIPLVGAVPRLNEIRQSFGDLKRNANKKFHYNYPPTNYWPDLYISAAHGSNGLATCGLSAEIIVSLMLNEQLPANQHIMDELNPVRFIIRALKKQEN